jgi:flavin-dependent dehydrogenase
MRQPPPLIIGGGPAGAAAAIALARAGAVPEVIERLAVPGDALCGGFLSWATLNQLAALGIGTDSLGGQAVTGLALFIDDRERRMALPAPGMGLSRRRLDTLLQQTAKTVGVAFRTGYAVQSLESSSLTLTDGSVRPWTSLFLATGKHDLRGTARPRDAAGADPALGLRLRLAPDPALRALVGDRIELHLFRGGYLGLILQEDGSLNACMAVHKSRLAQAGGDPVTLFRRLADESPALADRLATLPPQPRIDAIGHVPYGWRARDTRPGLFRLGDQAAVIPSLAGEGIGIALASAHSAVDHWLAEGPDGAQAYQRAFARRARRPLAVAGWMTAIGAWPTVAQALSRVPGAAAIIAALTRIGPA